MSFFKSSLGILEKTYPFVGNSLPGWSASPSNPPISMLMDKSMGVSELTGAAIAYILVLTRLPDCTMFERKVGFENPLDLITIEGFLLLGA